MVSGFRVNNEAPKISNVMFADDIILFGNAAVSEIREYLNLLSCMGFGLVKNWICANLASYLGGGTPPPQVIADIMQVAGMGRLQGNELYLGSPLCLARERIATFQFLLDRIQSKLSSWKIETLSQAGRTVLIKAVLSSIPSHIMQTTLLPVYLWRKMEAVANSFMWGERGGRRKIHLCSWEVLKHHKMEGGLGIRDFGDYNRAAVMKQAWKLVSNVDVMCVAVCKAKYLNGIDFRNAKGTGNMSYSGDPCYKSRTFYLQVHAGW